jgi:hypothetical protein
MQQQQQFFLVSPMPMGMGMMHGVGMPQALPQWMMSPRGGLPATQMEYRPAINAAQPGLALIPMMQPFMGNAWQYGHR